MAPPADTESSDVLTQIQDLLNGLVSNFFNFAGALQRDAPPGSIKGEDAPAGPHAINVGEQTTFMAREIAKQSKLLDELINKLPDLKLSDAQQLEAIAAAQRSNEQVGEALRQELRRAGAELSAAQDLFGVLADDKLLQKPPDPPNGH
jgi:hypothetical protein